MTMLEDMDNESCGSRPCDVPSSPLVRSSGGPNSRHQRQKVEVYNEVLRRLKDSGLEEARLPGFDDELWSHFNRLPARYALDVNVERAEDVLIHQRLLHLAHDPAKRPAIEVRLVQVIPSSEAHSNDSMPSGHGSEAASHPGKRSSLPAPAFGSSPNLEALALEVGKFPSHDDDDDDDSVHANSQYFRPMHEITFSSDDKPKLLSQLTSLLSDIGLNIQEAHAFSTVDGYSLDVFVVDGWPYEDTEHLKSTLEKAVLKLEKQSWQDQGSLSPQDEFLSSGSQSDAEHVTIPSDGADVWELDPKCLKFETKVASGSYGDLYKGMYCGQDVAIKVLKPERVNSDLQKEFAQEVYIMRSMPISLNFTLNVKNH